MVAGSTLFGTLEILVSEPALFGTVRKNIMVAQNTHRVVAKFTLFGTSEFIFLHHCHLATLSSLSCHFHQNARFHEKYEICAKLRISNARFSRKSHIDINISQD